MQEKEWVEGEEFLERKNVGEGVAGKECEDRKISRNG